MIALLQRVRRASVEVDSRIVAEIGRGLLVFIGIEPADDGSVSEKLLQRLLHYRLFEDGTGRMNLSLQHLERGAGGLLLVPQFTLAARTDSGNRASFSSAAPPAVARLVFQDLVERATNRWPQTSSGEFGSEMLVSLVNDGPVTFLLRS